MEYHWNFRFLLQYLPALLRGALVTLQLAGIAIAGGTIGGILLAVLRGANKKILRWPTIIVVEIGMALPLLVLLIWIYYCVPQITRHLAFNGFTVAAIALVLNLSPFVGETIRSGFATLPDDYALAARAVGMNQWQIFRIVTFPLALRRILPALITHYVTILKLVSICSIIAVPEIIHTANTITSKEFQPLEVYTAVAGIYVLIVLPFLFLARHLEKKFLVKN